MARMLTPSSNLADSSYDRQASTPSPMEMIRKGTRMETRSERSIFLRSRLRGRGRHRMSLGKMLRDDLIDLHLGVRLHPYVDLFQDPAPLHDDPQPTRFFCVGEDLFEIL